MKRRRRKRDVAQEALLVAAVVPLAVACLAFGVAMAWVRAVDRPGGHSK